ncbi:MAG: hypothetical protein PUP93_33175 [Rhizonema sp. NSF051]|nr:hypothetical protein [Rhizonema sp. NSF051]
MKNQVLILDWLQGLVFDVVKSEMAIAATLPTKKPPRKTTGGFFVD